MPSKKRQRRLQLRRRKQQGKIELDDAAKRDEATQTNEADQVLWKRRLTSSAWFTLPSLKNHTSSWLPIVENQLTVRGLTIFLVLLLSWLVARNPESSFGQFVIPKNHPASSSIYVAIFVASASGVSIAVLLLWLLSATPSSLFGQKKGNTITPEQQLSKPKDNENEFTMPLRPLGLRKNSRSIVFAESADESDENLETSVPIHEQLAAPEEIRNQLSSWLPFGLRHTSDLSLVFATNIHGRSLATLYHALKVSESNHTIMLLEAFAKTFSSTTSKEESNNTKGVLIGMYASHRWHNASNKSYGDGRSFLFRIRSSKSENSPRCWKWKPPTSDYSHPSTSLLLRNKENRTKDAANVLFETFQRSNSRCLSLGISANGVGAGLRLNHDMTEGESCVAVGFDNEPLVPSPPHGAATVIEERSGISFDVGRVEVYQLVREIDGRPIR